MYVISCRIIVAALSSNLPTYIINEGQNNEICKEGSELDVVEECSPCGD